MRNELVLTCCLLSSLPAAASSVIVRRANVTLTSAVAVRAACKKVETACTRFEAVELYCECALKDDRWTPRVRIEVQPRMYITSLDYVSHEFSHIFDFKNAMERYADKVETRSFVSQVGCDSFLGETRARFTNVLFAFRRDSMMRRDHEQSSGR